MVLKTDIIILLTYLGLQSNQISKRFKSCIDHFYWSYCLVVTQANHCSEFHMPNAQSQIPVTNCKSNVYRFSSELLTDILLTGVKLNLYLLTKFPQRRLSDLLTSLHFPRSLDIPIIMSFLALSRVRARSCEFFCKKQKRQIGQFQIIKIHSWLPGWGKKKIKKWIRSLIPKSQSHIFCFIHPSLGAKSEFW